MSGERGREEGVGGGIEGFEGFVQWQVIGKYPQTLRVKSEVHPAEAAGSCPRVASARYK